METLGRDGGGGCQATTTMISSGNDVKDVVVTIAKNVAAFTKVKGNFRFFDIS